MITFKSTRFFFDRKVVTDALDKAGRKALSRAGAFIRQTAKRSIRRARKKKPNSAPPGKPPRSHVGDLKRLIYFAYDPVKRGVVIGPVRFAKGEAPALLEFGGTVERKGRDGKTYTARYAGNPFMGPALQKELPNLPKRWQNSVRKTA